MALPAVTVSRRTEPPPRAQPTDTGLAYVTGITERGPTGAVREVRNLTQFVAAYGGRQTYSGLYDWLDTYFHEGGSRALISRKVGPSPVKASRALSDGSGTAVTAVAREYGAHANTWTIATVLSAGSVTYTLVGTEGDGTAFTETYGPYATVADLITADPFTHITFTLGTGVDPITAGAAALSGGTDDHTNITQTQTNTARTYFAVDYGPGQSVDTDVTSTAGHAALIAAADGKNRVALLDYADTATAATITAALTTDQAVTGSHSAAGYVNWLTIPPVPGSTAVRTVPPSALVAAVMARNDGQGLSVNEPPSGKNGIARWVTGTTQAAWSDTDRAALNTLGGNAIIDRISTGVTIFGARTMANPTTDRWTWVPNARFYGSIVAQSNGIGDEYVVGRLNRHRLASFEKDLVGLLKGYWPEDLVGDSPADAFAVDTSENTDTTMEAGQLLATLSLRIAGVAEVVTIQIVKVALTETVA